MIFEQFYSRTVFAIPADVFARNTYARMISVQQHTGFQGG